MRLAPLARPQRSFSALVLAAVLLVAACDSRGPLLTLPPSPPVPVDTAPRLALTGLTLASDSLTVSVGDSAVLVVIGHWSDGAARPVSGVVFTSTDPTVATIDGRGGVRAVSAGRTVLAAASGAVRVQGVARIVPKSLAHANIRPDVLCIAAGYSYQFVMHLYNDAGVEIPPGPVTWSVSDTVKASIDATGKLFTHAKPGGTFYVRGVAQGYGDQSQVMADTTPANLPMTCR